MLGRFTRALKSSSTATVYHHLGHRRPGSSALRLRYASSHAHHPLQSTSSPHCNASMFLVLDFDGTITTQDTIGVLVESALAFQMEKHGRHLTERWDQAVRDYMKDYAEFTDRYRPKEIDRRSVDEEVQFLSRLKQVEEASLTRVSDSGIFADLGRDELFDMGARALSTGRLQLRPGFERLMRLAQEKQWPTAVVSVNWSRSFIEGVLRLSRPRIIANEPDIHGRIRGPEFLESRLTTSPDKRLALEHITSGIRNEMLYFGDSTTDLECLLRGGIVIGKDENTSLMKTLERIGVSRTHVGEGPKDAQMFWAADFEEVLDSALVDE